MNDTTTTAPNNLPRPVLAADSIEDKEFIASERLREALWQAHAHRLRWQEWINFAVDGYVLTDEQGIIHEANYAAAELLGARKEFLLGKPLGLLMANGSHQLFYQKLSRLVEGGGVERWETRVCRPGGNPHDVALTASVLASEPGQDIKVRWMLHDVSETRQAKHAWQTEKNLADCLLETAEILVLLVDAEGCIVRANPHTRILSGHPAEELLGNNWLDLLLPVEEHEAGRQMLDDAWANGSGKSDVLALATNNGEHRRVQWSARKLGRRLLLIGHDVTQLQEAQRQALQAERLAVIGQMSAGLAHEGRNALQRIQACLSLLTLRLQDQPESLEFLNRMQKAQDDLLRLFEDVRTFAVVSRLKLRWSDLRQCWREAWSDLANLRPSADLQEDFGEVSLFCHVDPFYLKQVFRNLLENALASGADPVRVLIQCRPAMLDGEEAICIHLRDNGPGIPAAARAQLFEPFFTTKVRGTGLGLAICKRIIEAHGGRIEASNEAGSGAEIVITLPRSAP